MPTKTSRHVVVWQAALTPVAEDLGLLVLEAVLDVPVPVPVPVAVDVVVPVGWVPLTKLERLGSVVKTAVRPVTLWQAWSGVPVPATKFTAAHWNTSALRVRGHYWFEAYLVQDAIGRVLHDRDDTLLARPRSRHGSSWLTKSPQPGLLNDGH